MKIIADTRDNRQLLVEMSVTEWRALALLDAACHGAEDAETALIDFTGTMAPMTRGDITHWIDAVNVFIYSITDLNKAVELLSDVRATMIRKELTRDGPPMQLNSDMDGSP